MNNETAAILVAILRVFPLTAVLAYGYYTFSHALRRETTWTVSALLAKRKPAAWIFTGVLTVSRESFWHRLYSQELTRDLHVQSLAAAVASRTLLYAVEFLLLCYMLEWQPVFVAYLLFAGSLFLRLRPIRAVPNLGVMLFGAGLFLFPLVEPEFFSTGLIPQSIPTIGFAAGLILAAFADFGTTPLIVLTLILQHTGTLSPGTAPLVLPVIFTAGTAALILAGRKLGSGTRLTIRILSVELILFILFTAGFAGAGTAWFGEVSTPALFTLALAATAAAEYALIFIIADKTRPDATPKNDPLALAERYDYRICRKTEYLEAGTALLLAAITENFSHVRRLVQDVQNASALADETQQIRRTTTREEQTALDTCERIDRALHLLISHHPDRDADPRQETLQRINRHTARIAGRIVNLAEYFDRLRKKNAFFSEEESMAITELLVMVHDMSGYVSDYLAGRVNNLDAEILAVMEQQIEADTSGFRKKALARLSRARDTGVRKNLAVMETLDTIESLVRELDRVGSFAGHLGKEPRAGIRP